MNLILKPPVTIPHKTSIATVCLSGSLVDKLQAIADAGFDGVEIFENDLLHYPGTRTDIYNICQQLGLVINMYQPFRDLEGAATAEELQRSLERLDRKCQWMDELHTDMILLCSNCSPNAVGDRAKIVSDLRKAADVAKRYNKKIAYEALAWGTHCNTWENSWELVKEVDHPNLGLCLDSFHIFVRESDISRISEIPREKLFFIQLADAPQLKMDFLSYSRHHRNFPLQGEFAVLEFMEQVMKTGYTGVLSLEVFNDDFRAAPARYIAADGYRSLIFLQAEMYPGRVLPPLPETETIEYVEFAVDEGRKPHLESFFVQLGLRKVAKHRSKNVSVYRQGGVSFILNAEPESFASAYLLLHDCSVCAIAVRVADVQGMIARAAFLGCPVVPPSNLGKGEEHVVAIQAPDDTLIYLVDSDEFWKKDFIFDPEANPCDSDCPVFKRVDHIAQALDRLSIDRFVLFYKSVFGLHPQPVVEVNEPYGLTKSRAIVSENRALRFILNASDERNTSVGRLVRAASGSVVHHIAFDTDNIFRMAESMQRCASRGIFRLVPCNYYEDLAVRYNFDPKLVEKLWEHNIMYDRDERGEFLHMSTGQFRDRFHFEIVQRIGGYDGFAMLNATFHMAINQNHREPTRRFLGSVPIQIQGGENDKGSIAAYCAGSETPVDMLGYMLGK